MSFPIEPVISGVIGALSGAVATYVIAKRLINPYEILHEITDNIMTDTEMQRKIYLVGGLVGKGLRDGSGIGQIMGKGKKFSIENIIMGFAGNALEGIFGNKQQTDENPNAEAPIKQLPKAFQ